MPPKLIPVLVIIGVNLIAGHIHARAESLIDITEHRELPQQLRGQLFLSQPVTLERLIQARIRTREPFLPDLFEHGLRIGIGGPPILARYNLIAN